MRTCIDPAGMTSSDSVLGSTPGGHLATLKACFNSNNTASFSSATLLLMVVLFSFGLAQAKLKILLVTSFSVIKWLVYLTNLLEVFFLCKHSHQYHSLLLIA